MATGLLIDALVLAAGSGRRFGGGKLTTAYGEGALIDGALAAAKAAPARSVIVVTGADPGVEALALATGARVAHAANHAEGLSASLKTGIASLPDDADGVFVFLGDMPRVPVSVLEPMAKALESAAAVAPVFEGRRGNPVLLGRSLFKDVMALTGDAGAGKLLSGLGNRLVLVEAPDDGVLFDVDTRPG